MQDKRSSPFTNSATGSIALIAVLVTAAAAGFAYTAGWFSPARLTPSKLVATLAPPGGPALGFRRNHAKGICFTGKFDSNGSGSALSSARMLAAGSYAVTGRFNLATPDPKSEDGKARVRGLSLRIQTPDGQEWRSAMITAPFFPVATVQGFYELQRASARKDDPGAMKAFAATHPEFAAFGAWAGSAPFTGSYAEERYNGLNSFVFTNASGQEHAVRWSFVPAAAPVAVPAAELQQRDSDFLAKEVTERVQKQPQRWAMAVTIANPGDPTADPSKAWPADRRTVEVGTLVVSTIEPEPDGPCRDINFDPTVLPRGMRVSDDPFPAARSATYAVSFDRRTAEERAYPRTATGAKP
jgi:catalase